MQERVILWQMEKPAQKAGIKRGLAGIQNFRLKSFVHRSKQRKKEALEARGPAKSAGKTPEESGTPEKRLVIFLNSPQRGRLKITL